MISPDTYLILSVLLISLYIFYSTVNKKLEASKEDSTLTEWLKSIQGSLNASNQNLTSTLQRSYRDLHLRLDKAAEVMGELKREAGTFSEIGRSMQELQQFLQSPKLRGNIGEQVLNDLISQMFPKSAFYLQHSFKSGVIVDAAIKTSAGILPIDSKFPMENFQKLAKSKTSSEKAANKRALISDVKKHIRDISSKYILPEEDTLDFALMYVPSETVYYEIANVPELLDYARDHRVYPVSPTTLYAHLQTILLSFEGTKIESRSKEIFSLLRAIQKDHQKLETNLNKLNKHINNAYTQMNNTQQTFTIMGQKLNSSRTLEAGEDQ